MLQDAYREVKKHYYDPNLQGLDWDARYQQYSARIGTARDLGVGFRIVAAFLSGLKDSHTYFVPPARASRYDTGYRFLLVGDACFIAHVRPGTDAESKVSVGDQVLRLNGYDVNREDFHDIEYSFGTLEHHPSVQFDLRSPDGKERQVQVNAFSRPTRLVLDLTQGGDAMDLERKAEMEDEVTRSRIVEFADDASIWKLQQFDLNAAEVESAFGTVEKRKTLILDLRGNSGGSVDMLKYMVGSLFDHEVKISDRVGKNETKPIVSKRLGKPFAGKVIVLVDSGSASASEVLARVIQLEHRGTVVGDRTAGAVMEAKYYSESQGVDSRFYYGFSVTDANLIMSDGHTLEKTGVTPDELLLPTGADLAAGRDAVLAHAAKLAGVDLDPAAAGKLFPFKWLPL